MGDGVAAYWGGGEGRGVGSGVGVGDASFYIIVCFVCCFYVKHFEWHFNV